MPCLPFCSNQLHGLNNNLPDDFKNPEENMIPVTGMLCPKNNEDTQHEIIRSVSLNKNACSGQAFLYNGG